MTNASAPMIATSLKMYFDHDETIDWTRKVRDIALRSSDIREGQGKLVIFPSFPSLPEVLEIVGDAPIFVGAQNMAVAAHGPYTGEVSARTLRQIGCTYVELGHFERKKFFGETPDDVRAKVSLATEENLIPLICLGEEKQMSPEQAGDICIDFIAHVTGGITTPSHHLVFAYEPEWAIGAAEPASASYVRSVASRVGSWLRKQPGLESSNLIYGGSAGPGLLTKLKGPVDGLFLGRFAHDPAALEAVLNEI